MLQDLPPAFFKQVSAEFTGETILWAGRPDAFKTFLMLTPIWLFAVPWTVFSVGWEYIALSAYFAEGKQALDGAGKVMGVVFPIFGLPFVLIGLGMMSGPFWGWSKGRRTVYVLTDQRLATVVAGRNLNITSVDILRVSSVHRIEKPNGSGTLHLHMGSYRDSDGDLIEKKVTIPGVPDVRELERLVVAALRDKRKT
ncbi:MAG: hypothetical protein NTZ14_10060 [Hyphomicrobiales bacterium]|nr:hypothetical protein [Hyphomicrobiales bacterium]